MTLMAAKVLAVTDLQKKFQVERVKQNIKTLKLPSRSGSACTLDFTLSSRLSKLHIQ